MNRLGIVALALVMGASEAARADSVIVLNSEEASYSVLSRASRSELQRLPPGREPHHLAVTPDGKELLIASTVTNELVALDTRTGERKRVVRDIIDPYQLSFSPDGKWFVTAAYRLDHVDIYRADGFKLANRVFIDGLRPHGVRQRQDGIRRPAVEQPCGGLRSETQTIKWNVLVGKAPAGAVMPDNKRLLVALTGGDAVLTIDPKATVSGRLQTGKGALISGPGRWPPLVPQQSHRGTVW
jgi:DNA-binding beta-propeller fold protein YncE